VSVADNQQVSAGAPLFDIDPTLFRQALKQAQADLTQAQAEAQDAQADAKRATRLHQRGDLSDQDYDLKVAQAKTRLAAVASAQVALKTAELKLSYTQVKAPTNGYITNLDLDVGTYAAAGSPLIALVDADSFWVAGYFKETDLRAITVGDPALVRLMAAPDRPLSGTVESIAFGIAERNVGRQQAALAPVAPTFEWIRLAQRIPVRIALNERPGDLTLRIGYTASVGINPSNPASPHDAAAGQTD
jgi:RND family efflux transporter MFP subunit